MNAWVRFINKTNHNYITVSTDESLKSFVVFKDIPSGYCFFPAGCVNINISFPDNSGVYSERKEIIPSVLQTVVISNFSFSERIELFSIRDICT